MDAVISFDAFRLAPGISAKAEKGLLKPNPRLQQALGGAAANGLPAINVHPLSGRYLSILTRLVGAKTVLEVGTLGGYSSICFAEAGAQVTSIEMDPKHRAVAMENVAGLDVEVLLGKAEDVMPRLAKEGRTFDLVFIDAKFEGQWEDFQCAVPLTRPGGCIILDDVVPSMVKSGVASAQDGQTTIFDRIGSDERVDATLVPTVMTYSVLPTPVFGGFIFAIVKA